MTTAPSRSKIRCAIYTRKSSEEGLDQAFNSLDAQREACAAYVLSQAGEGWAELPTLYDDGGFSGGSMERPALKRLLVDIAAKRIDVVVVYKVDRLTRSLSDFARIVDTFDRAGASFVSVTQAFNTTSSMGRLTLNMLLSFAQFEREVTSERIRDKIAASKRKGMWMGGNLALGYDPAGRTLSINEDEAETVRHIFRRYLDLGSVEALRAELAEQGYTTKICTSARGSVRGGTLFSRGALFHLLSNRLYLGQIPHRGEFFPGLHPAIIDDETFQAAQRKLLTNAGGKRRTKAGLAANLPSAPLTGLIRDDSGNPMSPVNVKRSCGRAYRYYVSSATQAGRAELAGSLPRIPAGVLEELVLDRAQKLGLAGSEQPWAEVRDALVGVEVAKQGVRLTFARDALDREGQLDNRLVTLAAEERVNVEADVVVLDVATRLQRRGGAKTITRRDGEQVVVRTIIDQTLVRALARAEGWKRDLIAGRVGTFVQIAEAERTQVSHIQRQLRLAFLRPTLKAAILRGRTPPWLNLQSIMENDVPILWAAQTGPVD